MNTRSLTTAALLLGAGVLGASGCTETDLATVETSTSNTPISGGQTADRFNVTGSLQGTFFDAVTGQRLSGADLQLFVIIGTEYRTPDVFIRDRGSPLAGDFAFADLPLSMVAEGSPNIEYRVVAVKDGYQRFEGIMTLEPNTSMTPNNVPLDCCEGGSDGPSSGSSRNNEYALDTRYSFIRNIYMFPMGFTAPDLDIRVKYNGDAVPGATVLLQQEIDDNESTIWGGDDYRISPAPGLMPSLIAITDEGGLVTFDGDTLVLGGQYEAVVLPVTFRGISLAMNETNNDFTIGFPGNNVSREFHMSENEPGNSAGLHAIYASNRNSGHITGLTNPGVLTVVFNQPVALVAEAEFRAFLDNNVDASLTDEAGAGSVAASLSTDGLTLTLAPQFATAPTANDVNLMVEFFGGRVTHRDHDLGRAFNVFDAGQTDTTSIVFPDGTNIDTTVRVTGPQE